MDPATLAILIAAVGKIADRVISLSVAQHGLTTPQDEELIELKGRLRDIAVEAARGAHPKGTA